MQDAELQALIDRNDIIDTLSRYATGIDTRDKDVYRSCFTDEIHVNLSGSVDKDCPAEEWVDQAFAAVGPFQTTQHIITNHVVEIDGDTATCTAYLQAQHWNPDSAMLIGGYYEDQLVRTSEGWRIKTLKLVVTWSKAA